MDEDILLVNSWINISTDPKKGADQPLLGFWKRVHAAYHVYKQFDSDRNESSLEHRWKPIKTDCGKFSGFYAQIEQKNESGKTEQDKISDAKKMYKAMCRSPFKFMHCWEILRKFDKWDSVRDTLNTKRNRRSESPACSSPVMPDSINLGEDSETPAAFPNYNRPLGKKSSIRKDKGVRDAEFDPQQFDIYRNEREVENTIRKERYDKSFAEQQRQFVEEQKQFAMQFAQTDQFLELEKRKARTQERKARTQEEEADDKIMDLDITTMNGNKAMYYQMRQRDILKKRLDNV